MQHIAFPIQIYQILSKLLNEKLTALTSECMRNLLKSIVISAICCSKHFKCIYVAPRTFNLYWKKKIETTAFIHMITLPINLYWEFIDDEQKPQTTEPTECVIAFVALRRTIHFRYKTRWKTDRKGILEPHSAIQISSSRKMKFIILFAFVACTTAAVVQPAVS